MSGPTRHARSTRHGVGVARQASAAGPLLDLDHYVPALLTFVANKLSRSATATYQKRFGVNVTEWRILALLAIEPDIPARRICQVIGFDKGPVSRTLATMAARGLVTVAPDPDSRRSHVIALTPAGRVMHDRIIVVALARERRLLACLDPTEQELLIGLLGRIHGNLDALGSDGEATD